MFLSFLLFLASNSWTIVLGDKSAHTVTLHLPQLLYLSVFICIFSAPLVLSPALMIRLFYFASPIYLSSGRVMVSFHNMMKLGAGMIVIAATVRYNTYFHPYLLADNRHYVFYIFRRTLLRFPPYSLYIPIPIYFAALCLVFLSLQGRVTVAWVLLWIAGTMGTLVGAGLIEFRYFILPWVFWRLHVDMKGWRGYAELAVFASVNLLTIRVFLYRGFAWENVPGQVQRFMW